MTAAARTRIGDVSGAAAGFAYLLDFWRQTGQTTQLWTTARNAAGLLSALGRSRAAVLLLICADANQGYTVEQTREVSTTTYVLNEQSDDLLVMPTSTQGFRPSPSAT